MIFIYVYMVTFYIVDFLIFISLTQMQSCLLSEQSGTTPGWNGMIACHQD